MKYTSLVILLVAGYSLNAQKVGYRNIMLTDSGRRYEPRARLGERLYYRPVEIDCWYPADSAGAMPIYYGEFLQLFQQRANRFQDDTVYFNLAAEMTRYLSVGLGINDTTSLMRLATHSYWDATPIRRRFPLIVYLCSYNGMCYENTRLFEALVSCGYIVASITSVGRYPGNMTTDPGDLQEQVADALLAINMLRKSGSVDTSGLGLIGYSWGGLAAFLVAANRSVAAVLSLDGSELHYYGQSGEEDSNFNRLRPELLQATKSQFAYAYLESDGKQSEGPADSIFNIFPTFRGPKKYIRFPGATHEDFSSLPFLAASIRKTDSTALLRYPAFAINWFDNYLKKGANLLPPDSPYPLVSSRPEHEMTIAARVLDAEDDSPLAYVNVGIPGKNAGTVTSGDGSFRLKADSLLAGDTLILSMAGYEKQVIALRKVPKIILLHRRIGGLPEAIVTHRFPRRRILGNTTTSKLLSVGFPTRFPGSEMGVKISLGKNGRSIEKFHCHVSNTRVDSAVFRLNIFRIRNGKPENIMQRNILLSIRAAPGDYSVDLSGMNLILSGDILVSLELLRTFSTTPVSGAVFFSAGLFNSGTWRRQTSQAEWTKARGVGVGFNVEVR